MGKFFPSNLRCLATILALILSTVLNAQQSTRSININSLDRNLIQARPLASDEAFPYFLSVSSENEFSVTWTPAPGHYLYRHAFAFSVVENENAEPQALAFKLPDGFKKTDQFFGDIEAYYDQVKAEIQIDTAPASGANLVIEYQGCADWGFCYPPQRIALPLTP